MELRPFSHTIWDRHPVLVQGRSKYIKVLVFNVILLVLTVWAVLGIYWGSLWRVAPGVHNIHGWVVVCTYSFLYDTV
jgi:hypothetical protein